MLISYQCRRAIVSVIRFLCGGVLFFILSAAVAFYIVFTTYQDIKVNRQKVNQYQWVETSWERDELPTTTGAAYFNSRHIQSNVAAAKNKGRAPSGSNPTSSRNHMVTSRPIQSNHPTVTVKSIEQVSTGEQYTWDRNQTLKQIKQFLTAEWDPSLAHRGSLGEPLPEYDNHCWEENLPRTVPITRLYNKNSYIGYLRGRNAGGQVKALTKPWRRLMATLKERSKTQRPNWRMRCLPSVYIAGWHKAGTTDLFDALVKHPLILSPLIKESGFFSRSVGSGFTFEDYLEIYDPVAERIRTNPELLTLDATPETYLMWNWTNIPEGEAPKYNPTLFAAHIRAMTPKAKIIFIVRDPVTWLYSQYRHVTPIKQQSPQKFDACVRKQAEIFQNCLTLDDLTIRRCSLVRINRLDCPIQHGIYYIYLEEWLKIFPKEQIFVIRAEDYYSNREKGLEQIIDFLKLRPFGDRHIDKLTSARVSNRGRNSKSSMLKSTRQYILDFYKPFNRKMASLMNYEGYLWNDQTYD